MDKAEDLFSVLDDRVWASINESAKPLGIVHRTMGFQAMPLDNANCRDMMKEWPYGDSPSTE